MGPPFERDAVIDRPPVAGPSSAAHPKARDPNETNEKDRIPKRRFFELEEKHKEASTGLEQSGERNTRIREERNVSLDDVSSTSRHIEGDARDSDLHEEGAHERNKRVRISYAPSESASFADPNIDPALSGSGPSLAISNMEKILKVAEAAVAAQNAANASRKSTPSSSSSPAPVTTPAAANAGVNPSSSTSTSSRKTSNPYLQMGQPAPSVAPGAPVVPTTLAMNPYAMYYTGGANTPAYPHPYANPYYYMAGPMTGGSGMYPSGSNVAPQNAQRPSPEAQRQPKPKRLKAHTVTSKSFSIPMVPRDKQGKPMLPLNVGIMTVINLGTVCMREHFHTERYIFPVGYEVSRRYLSTVDPNIEVVYHCTILDGGDGPKFQIIPSDVPDRPVIAGTATGAWSNIVKQANAIRNRQHSNSVSGPDFFGLGQNTIKHLIQELSNSDRLRDYVWQTFVEGGPLGGRHAAVIPALPEEYDSAMPIGAYYSDKLKRHITSIPEAPKGLGHYPQHVQAEAQRHQSEQQRGSSTSVLQMESSADLESIPRQVSNGAAPPSAPPSRNTRQSARLRSSQMPYLPDAGPTGVGSASGEGASATFASLMSAFSTSGGPLPSQ